MSFSFQVFLDTLDMARGRAVAKGGSQKQRAFGAAIPALGLSNKAVYEGDTSADGSNAGMVLQIQSGFRPCSLPRCPRAAHFVSDLILLQ